MSPKQKKVLLRIVLTILLLIAITAASMMVHPAQGPAGDLEPTGVR